MSATELSIPSLEKAGLFSFVPSGHKAANLGKALVLTRIFHIPVMSLALGASVALGQQPPSSQPQALQLNHFSLAPEHFPPPHEAQIKTLLQGASAEQPDPDSRRYTIHQAKLRTFRVDGATNMIIEAPQCVYNSTNKTVDSSGPIQMQTGDGRFRIAGRGFLWQQENSSLVISNQVHTWASSGLFEPGTQEVPTNDTARETRKIEITSDRFAYQTNSGLGIYTGNVQVTGTNLAMEAGTLTLKMPVGQDFVGGLPEQNQLEHITAQTNVALDYSGIHATGQRADYSALTGQALLTGHPAWQTNQWGGRGDELVLDRTNKILRAKGNAFFKMPAQGSGASGLLLAQQETNADVTTPTNQTIEILSDNYEIRTNWAVFQKNVQVTQFAGEQPQGTMTCERMNATFGQSNQLQRLVAEEHVLINHTNQQFASGKAVYESTNGVLELTEHPSWRAGERRGRGELIVVHTNEMIVSGDAFMRLPASEFAQPGAVPAPANNAARPATNAPQFAEIFSETYTVRPEIARFVGGVDVRHPQMNWTCDTITVHLPPPGGTARRMVAEQVQEFVLADPNGQEMHGTGDRAIYAFDVVSGHTNETLTLVGSPALLERTNSTFRNSVIVVEPERSRLTAHGLYHMTVKPDKSGTNASFDQRIPKGFQRPKADEKKKP
jgi:lipopolysaccharide export system protein LptA